MAGPLRSWMFVPGNRQRFIDKALGLDADVIFLDLEDAVPPAEKGNARQMVSEALGRPSGGPLRYVRVNPVGSTAFEADLAGLSGGLAGVCLPKVERPAAIHQAAGRLESRERAHHLPDGSLRIVAMIESARGVLNAAGIAGAHPRVAALMLGAEDLTLDLGLASRREGAGRELLYPRSALVFAAAAEGVLAIDGIFPDLEDDEGLLADAALARQLGFHGKSLVHPRQIAVIHRVFSPTAEEVAFARRVIEAFEQAGLRGEGAIRVDGQLVDRPVVERARRVLAAGA